jgi:hypothetical protein
MADTKQNVDEASTLFCTIPIYVSRISVLWLTVLPLLDARNDIFDKSAANKHSSRRHSCDYGLPQVTISDPETEHRGRAGSIRLLTREFLDSYLRSKPLILRKFFVSSLYRRGKSQITASNLAIGFLPYPLQVIIHLFETVVSEVLVG